VSDTVSVKDSIYILGRRGTEVVSETLRGIDGRNLRDAFDNEEVLVTSEGRPRKGDAGAKEAVQRVVAHLRKAGRLPKEVAEVRDEHDKVKPQEPADCEVVAGDGEVLLRAQVVNAALDWGKRKLATEGAFRTAMSVDALADLLAKAIQHKAARYAASDKAKLALVLDAMDQQGTVAAEPVVRSFLLRHKAVVQQAGFRSVWVVGPARVHELG